MRVLETLIERIIRPYPEGNLKGLYPTIDIRP
jgi:hypothetical protein